MQIQWLQKYLSLLVYIIMTMTNPRSSIAADEQVNYSTYFEGFEPGFDLMEDEITKFKIWRKGVIPYFIDDVSFVFTLKTRLRALLDSYATATGLVFLELPSPSKDENERWVFFINRRGLLNYEDHTTNTFTNTGVQRVVLGYDCLGAGEGSLAATVLALAGVPPQHNSPDRDDHIEVVRENIIPESKAIEDSLILANKPGLIDTHAFEPGFDLTEDEMVKFKIWPKGVIPYYIDDVSFDFTMKTRLRGLLDSFASATGLIFAELSGIPTDENERWVLFINRRGLLNCEDYNTNHFSNAGVQRVVLGYDCVGADSGSLAATILALAGVPPQHNAPNRDQYIQVITDNIIPEKRQLFNALSEGEWIFYDIPYDFFSAGHYGFHKYTLNGSATIVPKDEINKKITVGEGEGISYKDIQKIKMLYNYMSLNRRKVKASACLEMFKPGKDFFDKKSILSRHVAPRPKPKQYLNFINQENIQPNKREVLNDEDEPDRQDKNYNEENNEDKFSDKRYNSILQLKKKANYTPDALDELPDINSD